MATNLYFTQGRTSEQGLYEDLIIESLKMYGQDVYYMPREIINRDTFFDDDSISRFDNAYKVEMYIENIEGFDGEGDLFTKFGVEIRDACTFVMARRRWGNVIAQYESSEDNPMYRPREGDLIYLTLSGSIFEITKVEDESPFYQLQDLPVFRMRAELFQYNGEDFDTNVAGIDDVEAAHAYQSILNFSSITGEFEFNETITQGSTTGEIVNIDNSDANNKVLYVAHETGTWNTTTVVTGGTSGAFGTPVSLGEDLQDGAMNDNFDTVSQGGTIDFIDFTESNPFGDP